MDKISKEKIDLRNLEIRNVTFNELMDRLMTLYYHCTAEDTIY
jgi:hypothetical protein